MCFRGLKVKARYSLQVEPYKPSEFTGAYSQETRTAVILSLINWALADSNCCLHFWALVGNMAMGAAMMNFFHLGSCLIVNQLSIVYLAWQCLSVILCLYGSLPSLPEDTRDLTWSFLQAKQMIFH